MIGWAYIYHMVRSELTFQIGAFALVPLDQARSEELADYQRRNRARFAPYAPLRTEAFFTQAYWRNAKRRAARERRRETAYRWVITSDNRVIGQINLDQITRGALQSAVLGYALDAEFEGQGLMTATISHVLELAFTELNLHRICAAYVPENARSAAVLKRLGFEEEGFARSFLRLNGTWKDHVLTARINPRSR